MNTILHVYLYLIFSRRDHVKEMKNNLYPLPHKKKHPKVCYEQIICLPNWKTFTAYISEIAEQLNLCVAPPNPI